MINSNHPLQKKSQSKLTKAKERLLSPWNRLETSEKRKLVDNLTQFWVNLLNFGLFGLVVTMRVLAALGVINAASFSMWWIIGGSIYIGGLILTPILVGLLIFVLLYVIPASINAFVASIQLLAIAWQRLKAFSVRSAAIFLWNKITKTSAALMRSMATSWQHLRAFIVQNPSIFQLIKLPTITELSMIWGSLEVIYLAVLSIGVLTVSMLTVLGVINISGPALIYGVVLGGGLGGLFTAPLVLATLVFVGVYVVIPTINVLAAPIQLMAIAWQQLKRLFRRSDPVDTDSRNSTMAQLYEHLSALRRPARTFIIEPTEDQYQAVAVVEATEVQHQEHQAGAVVEVTELQHQAEAIVEVNDDSPQDHLPDTFFKRVCTLLPRFQPNTRCTIEGDRVVSVVVHGETYYAH